LAADPLLTNVRAYGLWTHLWIRALVFAISISSHVGRAMGTQDFTLTRIPHNVGEGDIYAD
jgi:hypothetical protein